MGMTYLEGLRQEEALSMPCRSEAAASLAGRNAMRAAPTPVPAPPAAGAAGGMRHARVAPESPANLPPSFPESGLGEIGNHRRQR